MVNDCDLMIMTMNYDIMWYYAYSSPGLIVYYLYDGVIDNEIK